MENGKARAWDAMGAEFWLHGRPAARPSANEIGLYLELIPCEASCAILGASSRDLVECASRRGLKVTVFDFSKRMVDALLQALPSSHFEVVLHDVTKPFDKSLRRSFDFVLADRLINRLTTQEARGALTSVAELLLDEGEFRTAVHLGLYPMDLLLLKEAKSRGILSEVWDESAHTIDYCAAREILAQCILPHGDIPRDILQVWYENRGKESRYNQEDIEQLVSVESPCHAQLSILRQQTFPDAMSSQLFYFKPRRDGNLCAE